MKKIKLSQQGKHKGKFVALVDDADYEKVNAYRWSVTSNGYAAKRKGARGELILMHKFIMGSLEGKEVDHINMNKLDNRRKNLRLVTRSQNSINRLLQRNNTSGYRGVSWNRTLGYWVAGIKIDNKRKHLGYFKNKEEAALSYNRAAKIYHGDFAMLNKVVC